MVKRAAKFTFPPELIKEPIIYNLSQQFKVVTNIRRADVNGDKGVGSFLNWRWKEKISSVESLG